MAKIVESQKNSQDDNEAVASMKSFVPANLKLNSDRGHFLVGGRSLDLEVYLKEVFGPALESALKNHAANAGKAS